MSEKKQKNVQAAETQKPNKEPETAIPAQPEPASQSSVGNAPSIVELAKGLDEGKVQLAESAGIPIRGILQWAYNMEQTLNALLKNLPATVQENTKKAMQTFYEQQAQAIPQGTASPTAPQGMGFDIGTIMQLASKALGEGNKPNPLQEKAQTLMNTLLDRAIESVTEKSSFERYFEEEVAKAKAKAMAAQVVQ